MAADNVPYVLINFNKKGTEIKRRIVCIDMAGKVDKTFYEEKSIDAMGNSAWFPCSENEILESLIQALHDGGKVSTI